MRRSALLLTTLLAALTAGCDDRRGPEPVPEGTTNGPAPAVDAPAPATEVGVAEAPANPGPVTPPTEAATTPDGTHVGVRRPAPAPGAPGAPEATPPGTDARPPAAQKPPPKGLEILPNNRWNVSQALADRWQENPYRLGHAEEQGTGWRLNRIRPYGPGWYLGLRNGDVIVTVNGMALDTKPQLLAAYLKLKNDRSFEVKIRRGGETRTHHYHIVD